MKKSLLSIFCLMFPMVIFALDGNHYNYVPKSPEAAAFDRVPDIPVSNYTGSLSFSIPIYTLVSGDITVPISLDYQGNAIPVNQEATWVGLNWLLNAGGVVTSRLSTNSTSYGESLQKDWEYALHGVSMQRIPLDGEFSGIYYKMDGSQPNWRGSHGKNWFKQTFPENVKNGDLSPQLYTYILDKQSGETPTFHACFLGNSLTYIWDRLKNEFFIAGRKQNFKITGSPSAPTIIDGKGIKYSFTETEIGSPEGYLVNPEGVNQDHSMFLSKIESPSGHVVKFKYAINGDVTAMYSVNENLYSSDYPQQAIGTSYRNTFLFSGSYILDRSISQLYKIRTLRLAEIESDEVVVKFVPSSKKRLDLDGDCKMLDRIEIYAKGQHDNQLVKAYSFSYSYFQKVKIGGNTVRDLFDNNGHMPIYDEWFPSDDFMYYRLRLDSFGEQDSNGVCKGLYKFRYFDGLPCKASASVDYWGYFNGQENSIGKHHTLLPTHWSERTADVEQGFPLYMNLSLGDRRFNENYAKAGMLGSITYPTGGEVGIVYEGHRFSNYTYFGYGTTSTARDFRPLGVYVTNQSYGKPSGLALNDSVFTVNEEGTFSISLHYAISNEPKNPCWRNVLSHPLLLYHYGTYFDRNGPHEVINGCDVISVLPSDTVGKRSLSVSQNFRLAKGKYKLSIAGGENLTIGMYPQEYYYIEGKVSLVKSNYISVGAGLRVKSISHNDGHGNITTSNFEYTNLDYSSSGILMTPAIFARRKILVFQNGVYQKEGLNEINPPTAKEIRYAQISGTNANPNPPFVGYSRVTIRHKSEGIESGKEVFSYRNKPWGTTMLASYCRMSLDPRNGMLLSDSIFDAKEKLVRAVNNSYKWNLVDSRLLGAVVENIYCGPNEVTGGNALYKRNAYLDALGGGCMQIYMYPSFQFSLKSSHALIAEYNAGVRQVSECDGLYNQSNGLDSVVTQVLSEKSDKEVTETYYPSDFPASSKVQSLKSQHINEVPIESLSSVTNDDGTFVSSDTRYEYNSSGNVSAEYQWKSNVDVERGKFMTLKDSYDFSSFDKTAILAYNKGNKPRMVQENDGGVVVYLWGYGNQYPIAVVRGTDYSSVSTLLGGNSVVDNLESAMCPTLDDMALYERLCTLKGCEVTTYSYSPLVGMVTMVTPNGERTSYTYDTFCRLSSVLDHDDIVSSAIKYNFKR